MNRVGGGWCGVEEEVDVDVDVVGVVGVVVCEGGVDVGWGKSIVVAVVGWKGE